MNLTIVANTGIIENESGEVIHRFQCSSASTGHLARLLRDLGHEVSAVWENTHIVHKLHFGDDCPECSESGSLTMGTTFHAQNGILLCSHCNAEVPAIEITKSRHPWIQSLGGK